MVVDEHPNYKWLAEDEGECQRKYEEFVHGMLRGREAMKGEKEKGMIYAGIGFLRKIEGEYNISEKINLQGRPGGWRKNKGNRPL